MKSIRKKSDFQVAIRNGKKYRGIIGTVYCLSSNEPGIGIVTKRELGKAVDRNRIRRKIREALKNSDVKAKIVIFPYPIVKEMKQEQLIANVQEICHNINKNI